MAAEVDLGSRSYKRAGPSHGDRQRLAFACAALLACSSSEPIAATAPAHRDGGHADLMLGFGGVGVLVDFGALVSALRSTPAGSVTFSESGIQERLGKRVHEHGWDWIEAAVDDAHTVTLHCRQELKSFTVALSDHQRTFVIDKHQPEFAELMRLLEAHAPNTLDR